MIDATRERGAERKTLRQISAARLAGEAPPPAIDDAEARAQRERARAILRDVAATLRRIERKERT